MATSEPKLQPLALRINDAAKAIGISRSKLYQLVSEGRLRVVKIGGVAVIRREDLEALLAS